MQPFWCFPYVSQRVLLHTHQDFFCLDPGPGLQCIQAQQRDADKEQNRSQQDTDTEEEHLERPGVLLDFGHVAGAHGLARQHGGSGGGSHGHYFQEQENGGGDGVGRDGAGGHMPQDDGLYR